MKNINLSRHVGAVSALALTAAAAIASVQPAAAATGIYGGGSSLFSVAFRQLADCYHGRTPANLAAKPASCTGNTVRRVDIELLYASVGSGSGRRAFTSNDSRQLLSGSASPLSLPASNPQYLDTAGFLPKVYPYPEMDFGASDDPLSSPLTTQPFINFNPASNWQNVTGTITASVGASITYSTTKYGAAIQVPAAEVGVAIPVNAPKPSAGPWQIAYQGNSVLHLSQPQLCAIFSGAVTNWNDSTTNISYRDSADALQSEAFMDGNGGSPYTSSSLPIQLVYRGDGSGTTFIMTNFLSAVCPFFATASNKYAEIFGTAATPNAMPSATFSKLIANIKAAFPARGAWIDANWFPQTGSGAVAANIGNQASNPGFNGRIGYVSSDFVQPYSKLTNAPLAAAVQDEAQRRAGVYHATSGATAFVAPTPASLNLSWLELVPPTSVAYTDWNVYAQTHSVFGGQQRSILATPTRTGAYPLSGTTFLSFYSCYADPTGTRVPALTDFLSWLYGGSTVVGSPYAAGVPANSTRNDPRVDPNVKALLKLNGFYPLPAKFEKQILYRYVTDSTPPNHYYAIEAFKPGGPQKNGCLKVTGGGAQ